MSSKEDCIKYKHFVIEAVTIQQFHILAKLR